MLRRRFSLLSMGKGYLGSLGHGNYKNYDSPTNVPAFENVNIAKLSMGWAHGAVVTEIGQLVVFGQTVDIRLPLRSSVFYSYFPQGIEFLNRWGIHSHVTALQPVEMEIPKGEMAMDVSCGGSLTAMISNKGNLYCFGANAHGQCGIGSDVEAVQELTQVIGMNDEKVKHVSAGFQHVLALTETGTVYSFGKGESGQLGYPGQGSNIPKAIRIPQNKRVSIVGAGLKHSAAVTDDGQLYVWGKSLALTVDKQMDQMFPRHVRTRGKVIQMVSSQFHIMFMTEDAKLWVLGKTKNDSSQVVNDGRPINTLLQPQRVKNELSFKVQTLCKGVDHTGIIAENGHVYAWNWNKGIHRVASAHNVNAKHYENRNEKVELLSIPKSKLRVKQLTEHKQAVLAEKYVHNQQIQSVESHRLHYYSRWDVIRAFYQKFVLGKELGYSIVNGFASSTSNPVIRIQHAENIIAVVYRLELKHAKVHHQVTKLLSLFDRNGSTCIDVRLLLCSFQILEFPYMDLGTRIRRWVNIYRQFDKDLDDTSSKVSTIVLRDMILLPVESEVIQDSFGKRIDQLKILRGKYMSSDELVEQITLPDSKDIHDYLHKLCWDLTFPSQRAAFYRKNYIETIEQHTASERTYRVQQAIAYWRLLEPRKRMDRWKIYVAASLKKKMILRFWVKTCHQRAIVYFQRLVHRNVLKRKQNKQAIALRKRHHLFLVFHPWILFYHSVVEMDKSIENRGYVFCRKRMVQNSWDIWAYYLYNIREHEASLEKLLLQFTKTIDLRVQRVVWGAWQTQTHLAVETKRAEQRQQRLEMLLNEDKIQNFNLDRMEEEDIHAHYLRDDYRAAQELRRESIMKKQSNDVYEKRKIRQQEIIRTREKQALANVQLAAEGEFWNEVEENAILEARNKALKFYGYGSGADEVMKLATWMYEEEPEEVKLKLRVDPSNGNVPRCIWQMKLEYFGGKVAHPCYFNQSDSTRVMCVDLEIEICKTIAKEMFVQKKVNLMLDILKEKAAKQAIENSKEMRATQIQMMFHCYKARKYMRNLMRMVCMRRIDPLSGEIVYYNTSTLQTSFESPKIMGSASVSLPIESSTWVPRIDMHGVQYYKNLETKDTSWTAPPHYVMCYNCRTNFVTRRCNETGMRYCISCCAEGIKKGLFPNTYTWTKIPVQEAKCMVCRVSPAERVCHDCKGDVLCLHCFTAVHKSARLKKHTIWDKIGKQDY